MDERTAKLTKAQREVYDHMREGYKAYFTPYGARLNPAGDCWHVAGLKGKRTRQVEKLLELGLIQMTGKTVHGKVAEVSE